MTISTLEVTATALAHGGEVIGVPAQTHSDQRKVFFRGAIPGEIARVTLTEQHKNFSRATLTQINKPHPDRIPPPCPYFDRCGGCDYQHMPIHLQRSLKRDMVESMLSRQAKAIPEQGVHDLSASLPAYEYRRRLGLHISPSLGPRPAQLGFFREGSGEVVDITACMIATPALNCAIRLLRTILPLVEQSFSGVVLEEYEGKVFATAKLREDALELVDHSESPAIHALSETFDHCCVLSREKPIFSQYDGAVEDPENRSFPSGRFSQVNVEGNEILKHKVTELVAHPEVTDLYAGAGNFSIPLALKGRSVEAVELDDELVRLGRLACFSAGVPEHRLRFTTSSCEQFLKTGRLKRAVVLDPPRSGADAVAKALNPRHTSQVVYVSCSLPTLCRDAKTMLERGFSLRATWMIDMFAQTHHVETISLFESR